MLENDKTNLALEVEVGVEVGGWTRTGTWQLARPSHVQSHSMTRLYRWSAAPIDKLR